MSAPGLSGATVFVSSFSTEEFDPQREGRLAKLRQRLAELNSDPKFRRPDGEAATWVELPKELPLRDNLGIADRLVHIIQQCDYYVCILADRRRGAYEHGTPIALKEEATNVTFFEIELYAAAMLRKRAFMFALEGFSPGPRLQKLLKLLSWAYPGWQALKPQTPDNIFAAIRELLENPLEADYAWVNRLVKTLYTERVGPILRLKQYPRALFFDGVFEPAELPEKGRIEFLIREYRQARNFQHKATRLWFAVRELLSASYLPHDVSQHSQLREFLPYWDCVLADWAGIASWQGWHGHLYAGTIAPLNSQLIVRSQMPWKPSELTPEITLPPDGALASAYYNVAKVTGMPFAVRPLIRAGIHIRAAIDRRKDAPLDNLLAIRGSIRLRLGNWSGAVIDFKEMRRIRERSGAPPQKVADALMHLGTAFSLWPLGRVACDYLDEAVRLLEAFPDDPNLPRARRKLALAQRSVGRIDEAVENDRRATEEALRQGALDQLSTNRS